MLLQYLFDSAIGGVDYRLFVQAQIDTGNQITIAGFVLENTVAVAEPAIGPLEKLLPAVGQLDGLQVLEGLFELHSVGANILDGGRPYGAWYQRQVFYAPQVVLQGVVHQILPDNTTGSRYQGAFLVFFNNLNTL